MARQKAPVGAIMRLERALEKLEQAMDDSPESRCAVAPEHKRAMRLYLETWVAGDIREVLPVLRGEPIPWQWRDSTY